MDTWDEEDRAAADEAVAALRAKRARKASDIAK